MMLVTGGRKQLQNLELVSDHLHTLQRGLHREGEATATMLLLPE